MSEARSWLRTGFHGFNLCKYTYAADEEGNLLRDGDELLVAELPNPYLVGLWTGLRSDGVKFYVRVRVPEAATAEYKESQQKLGRDQLETYLNCACVEDVPCDLHKEF